MASEVEGDVTPNVEFTSRVCSQRKASKHRDGLRNLSRREHLVEAPEDLRHARQLLDVGLAEARRALPGVEEPVLHVALHRGGEERVGDAEALLELRRAAHA